MPQAQTAIFVEGATSSEYIEIDLGTTPLQSPTQLLPLFEAEQDEVGVNFVVGLRPELAARIAPGHTPDGVHGFNEPVTGPDGFTMPATQHDLALWITGGARDHVFDTTRRLIALVLDVLPGATVAEEVEGWTYRTNRDLTGFIDGTENPSTIDQYEDACVPDGHKGEGSSILLLQKWRHLTAEWEALPVTEQEDVIGRTKTDSVELDPKPASSHAERTDQDDCGHIVRRNMPYGDVGNHGTMFTGFSCEQKRLHLMLEQMAGADGGPRDALTRFTTPESGSYYVIPPVDAFRP